METNQTLIQQKNVFIRESKELDSTQVNSLKARNGEKQSFSTEIGTILIFRDDNPKMYKGLTYAAYCCEEYTANGDFIRIFYFPANGLDKLDYPKAEKGESEKRCINRDKYATWNNYEIGTKLHENDLCLKVCDVKKRFVPTYDSTEQKYVFNGTEKETPCVRIEIVSLPDWAIIAKPKTDE